MWTIRIDDKIESYGCKIIPVYALLKDSDSVELMDAIDEDPTVLEPLIELFKHKKLLEIIITNPTLKTLLIDNAVNKKFLVNMNYLFKKRLNKHLLEKIKRDPAYIQYFVLASINSNNNAELKRYYKLLREINVNKIDALLFISVALNNTYKFEYLLENFFTLKKNLSENQLNKLVQYPEQFAYFLYPSKEDMNIGTYAKRKQFQKLMIDIYKSSYHYYLSSGTDENEMALTIVENIYPYIVANKDYDAVEKLLNNFIQRGFIHDISKFSFNDPCSDDFKKNYAKLFGGNNIDNILQFKKEEPRLYKELLNSESPTRNIFSLFYIVKIYHTFSRQKKDIFFNLLNDLAHDKYTTSIMLQRLDEIEYFDKVILHWDYNKYVKASEDDTHGMSAPKYKYILTTSANSQDDPTVLDYINHNDLDNAKKYLKPLYTLSIEELSDHRFTAKEKATYWIDNLSYAVDGGLLVTGFVTGGATWGVLIAKNATKFTAKKGIKMYVKKLALASSRLINQGIRLSTKSKSMITSKLGKSNLKSFEKSIDSFDDKFSIFQASMAGGLLYFALSNHLEAKELCPKEGK